jgi:hypothetical protein
MESMLLTRIEVNNQKHIPVDGGMTKEKVINILQNLQPAEDVGEVMEFFFCK